MNGLGVDRCEDSGVRFYFVEMTAAESADYVTHEEVFEDIAVRNVFSDEDVTSRIEAFGSGYRSRFYYGFIPASSVFAAAYVTLLLRVRSRVTTRDRGVVFHSLPGTRNRSGTAGPTGLRRGASPLPDRHLFADEHCREKRLRIGRQQV